MQRVGFSSVEGARKVQESMGYVVQVGFSRNKCRLSCVFFSANDSFFYKNKDAPSPYGLFVCEYTSAFFIKTKTPQACMDFLFVNMRWTTTWVPQRHAKLNRRKSLICGSRRKTALRRSSEKFEG